MKIVRKILLVLSMLIATLIGIAGSWSLWQHVRNPVNALNRGTPELRIANQNTYKIELNQVQRKYVDITLRGLGSDSIKITMSFPVQLPDTGLPVLVLLGGLEIGRESLRYVPRHGENILIAYQYPYSPRYWYDKTAITQIPAIRRSVLKVPAQVEGVARWALEQNWCGRERISILGYSFGAMFVPAVYRLAIEHGVEVGPGVIAYGGADLYLLLRTNLKFLSAPVRPVVSWLAASAILPVEPALHLPHIKSELLIINGKLDHQIPEESWQKLQNLAPEPKTVINLEAGHLNPAKPELTHRLVEISRKWLLERNVINP